MIKPYHVCRRHDDAVPDRSGGVFMRADSPESAARRWAIWHPCPSCIVDVYHVEPADSIECNGAHAGTYRVERTVTVTPVTP